MVKKNANQAFWNKKHHDARVMAAFGAGLNRLRDLFNVVMENALSAAHDSAPPGDFKKYEEDCAEQKRQFEAQLLEHATELIAHRKFVHAMGVRTINAPGHVTHGWKQCRTCQSEWVPGVEDKLNPHAAHRHDCAWAILARSMGWK